MRNNSFTITNLPNGGCHRGGVEFDGVYFNGHQPTHKHGKYFIVVGEIYNGDELFCVSMYEEYGYDFVNHLDGDFLVIIYDPSNQTIDFFTDPWATRQAHYTAGDFIYSFSTWPTKTSKSLKWNSHYQYSIGDNQLRLVNGEIYKWDLRQYKNTLEDMTIAFEEAVLKRYHDNMVLAFSGGMDSSCVALCLAENEKTFHSAHLSLVKIEDENTISEVVEYTKPYNNFIRFDELPEGVGTPNSETFYKAIHKVVPHFEILCMPGAADPLLDNDVYKGKFLDEFQIWPEDLTTIFPWTLFYGSRRVMNAREHQSLRQNAYIMDTFRDRNLVQEWLNVTHTLKNKESKIMQREYLRKRHISIPTVIAGIGHQWDNEHGWGRRPAGGWAPLMKVHEIYSDI